MTKSIPLIFHAVDMPKAFLTFVIEFNLYVTLQNIFAKPLVMQDRGDAINCNSI